MQVLSPAGSLPALKAAVYAGADAVYLGALGFNARMNAQNFSESEIREGIRFCHERGVEVHATLNTLVSDRELADALDVAAFFTEAGADAFIVQDVGLAKELMKRTDVPLHGSTQMTVHSLDGVGFLADLGFTRAVLSRELSRRNIEYIAAHAPIETEIFAHGALCMCYSGQCYMSSVIGARSGNRGRCAQPCRLPYQNGYALSLKDMCLLRYTKEIEALGVDCIKLEGRMKSPGYVYAVTRAYADAVRGKEYDPEEEKYLADVFSRDGFTDGYYLEKKGADMFGVRSETTETPRVEEKEYKRFLLDVNVSATDKDTVLFTARTSDGLVAEETLSVGSARTSPSSLADVEKAFSRLGDTVYTLKNASGNLPENAFLPAGVLNAVRRKLIASLTDMRCVRAHYYSEKPLSFPVAGCAEPPRLEAFFLSAEQVGQEAEKLDKIWLPLACVGERRAEALFERYGEKIGVSLPTVITDSERLTVKRQIVTAKEKGVTDALCNTIGAYVLAKEAGLCCHGDFGLNVYNRLSRDAWQTLGIKSVTMSFEMNLAQLIDAADPSCVMIGYGRLPFMISENCTGKKHCGKPAYLKDRTGKSFLMTCEPGCRMRLWNADKLYLADKDLSGVGAVRLLFTDEEKGECDGVIRAYRSDHRPMPETGFTRGLYFKKV